MIRDEGRGRKGGSYVMTIGQSRRLDLSEESHREDGDEKESMYIEVSVC